MEGFCFVDGLTMFSTNHQSEYVVHGSAPPLISSFSPIMLLVLSDCALSHEYVHLWQCLCRTGYSSITLSCPHLLTLCSCKCYFLGVALEEGTLQPCVSASSLSSIKHLNCIQIVLSEGHTLEVCENDLR